MHTFATKNLTKEYVQAVLLEVTAKLFDLDLCFTVIHKRNSKSFKIISVKSADAFASLYSNVELDFKNGAKYAEMVINYE